MNRRIPSETITEIRKNNDIVEVIEQYVHLEKRGNNYFGLCPFHNENTPSFTVTRDKQIYHCFGCKASGNVITFIMELETLNYVEAVSFLAERAGITLPERKKQRPLSKDTEALLKALEWLTKYYNYLLKYADEGKAGSVYFKERGIDEETIDHFQLGMAPRDSELTVQFLQSKDIHLQTLVKYGVLSSRDIDQYRDPFRGRVIFPIRNHFGQVIALGGRSIQDETPKYLNSREHSLFQKGSVLYNFDFAKNYIRRSGEVILFEGYMDVLSAHQADIKNVVATLGTALTEAQARLLRRYVEKVILCYDGDGAGKQASFEAATLLKQVGADVYVAELEENMDPDEYIQTFGGDTFKRKIISQSDTYFKFFMKYRQKKYNLTIESERITYIEEVLKELAKVRSTIEQDLYINELAEQFNLSKNVIQENLAQHKKQNKPQAMDNVTYKTNTNANSYNNTMLQPLPAYKKAERTLLIYMIHYPHVIEKVQEKVGINFNLDEHKVILTHLYALYEDQREINLSELVEMIDDPSIRQLATELGMNEIPYEISNEVINDCIHVIQRESTDKHYLETLRQKQREEQDPLVAVKIGQEIIELEKRLKN